MSLALYRRYRPESYAEVIGQEHVTGPLQQALRNDRVHHAYLFSGPRGCGKTTSARILARCLNCEQGPTPEPCGVCDSCVALARGGAGSLDVIEIDAASHGGVDDARDLRERAFFAPASSRFKIYIVDEAHMVTTQGFNALLKLVEEPPEHVKFIFATTEPEKVIGTIRSRTHHYPFRLVPPGTLTGYLADLCLREGIAVDPVVLPLVVRAGGGSVRDSLSVLDQLLSGAGAEGVTYAMAAALLGYTDTALLDAVMDAFAASDGAAAFELIDRVVEAGHDPRRFVADLLDRVRDLMLVDAVPDAVEKGLVVGPPEAVAALPGQAARFGSAELVRAAEILNVGLTEMRGATAPRLQLELICARVLLPSAAADEIGLIARVDRLERRLAIAPSEAAPGAGGPSGQLSDAAEPASRSAPASRPAAARGTAAETSVETPVATVTSATAGAATSSAASRTQPKPHEVPPARADAPASTGDSGRPSAEPAGSEPRTAASPKTVGAGAVESPAAARVPDSTAPASTSRAAGGLDIIEIRRQWPAVLDAVKSASKVTWMMMFEKVTVASVDAERLVLAFPDGGTLKGFMAGGRDAVLRDAMTRVLGLTLTVDGVLDSSRAAATPAAPVDRPAAPAERTSWAVDPVEDDAETGERARADSDRAPTSGAAGQPSGRTAPRSSPDNAPSTASTSDSGEHGSDHRMPRPGRGAARDESPGATTDSHNSAPNASRSATRDGGWTAAADAPRGKSAAASAARSAARARTANSGAQIAPTVATVDVPDPDSDPDAADSDEAPADLLARTLGAVVVERVSDS